MLDNSWPKTNDGKPINANISKIGNPSIVNQASGKIQSNIVTDNKYGILLEDAVPAMMSLDERNDTIAAAYKSKPINYNRKAATKVAKTRLHSCVQECSTEIDRILDELCEENKSIASINSSPSTSS